MNVKVAYTGIDGKTTRFGATSPTDAMARLGGIRGYNGGIVDAAAKGIVEAYNRQPRKNAAHVAEITRSPRITIRDRAGVVSANGGQAASVTSVKDVRLDENGNLVVTKRNDFIGENGSIAGVGGAVEQNLGRIKSDVSVTGVEKDVSTGKSSVRVMVGARYDTETHRLMAKMAMLVVSDGIIKLVDDGEDLITTAVEETVVS